MCNVYDNCVNIVLFSTFDTENIDHFLTNTLNKIERKLRKTFETTITISSVSLFLLFLVYLLFDDIAVGQLSTKRFKKDSFYKRHNNNQSYNKTKSKGGTQ